jgi:NAD(P)-dependent dehydrogenase (short-subunit alcohol dehydrogenase family)
MNDLFSLRGRVALVTGGSRGIGRMIATGFLRQGARVYITARKAAACDATAAELSCAGRVHFHAGRRFHRGWCPGAGRRPGRA